MRYLSLQEVYDLHRRVIGQSGGSTGVRDAGAAESAVAQPFQTFGGKELYPTLTQKAASLGYFIIQNHPFVDGNKRTGHAAMEVTLVMNGFEIAAEIDEQEQVILSLASGTLSREQLTEWLENHAVRRT